MKQKSAWRNRAKHMQFTFIKTQTEIEKRMTHTHTQFNTPEYSLNRCVDLYGNIIIIYHKTVDQHEYLFRGEEK